LNEERRRELTRVTAKYAEQARVSVRNIRRDGVETASGGAKRTPISRKTSNAKLQQGVQHLTDEYVKRIDEALAQKDREILQV